MAYASQRLLALIAAVFIVSAVLHEAVTIPVSFQPVPRAVPVLA